MLKFIFYFPSPNKSHKMCNNDKVADILFHFILLLSTYLIQEIYTTLYDILSNILVNNQSKCLLLIPIISAVYSHPHFGSPSGRLPQETSYIHQTLPFPSPVPGVLAIVTTLVQYTSFHSQMQQVCNRTITDNITCG